MHIAYLEQPNFALRALPGLFGEPTPGIRIVLTGPSLLFEYDGIRIGVPFDNALRELMLSGLVQHIGFHDD